MEQLSVRVPDGTQNRVDALIPYVAKQPNVDIVAAVSRANVLRLVFERGLAALEAEAKAGGK